MKKSFQDDRPSDPYMADYMRIHVSLEECVRQLLGRHVQLCAERILRYRSVGWNGIQQFEFRELDAVCAKLDQLPTCAVEIKVRERVQSGSKGIGQLEQSLSILRQRWSATNGVFVTVWMAPILGIDDAGPEDFDEFSHVVSFAAQPASSVVSKFILDGQRLLQDAIGLGLWTSEQTSKLIAARLASIEPLSTFSDPTGDKPLNPLSRLFDDCPSK
jgi:hypothetical protein